MNRRFDYWYLLLVIPILRICLPLLQYRFRMIVIVPFFVLWLIHMLCQPVRTDVPCLRQLRTAYLGLMFVGLLYDFLPLFYMRFGLPYNSRVVFNWAGFVGATVFCFLISIVYFSFVHKRFKELAFLLVVILSAAIYSGFMSFLHGDQIEGGAARFTVTAGSAMSRGVSSAYDNFEVVAEYGLSTYSHVYEYALYLPIMVYAVFCIKRNRKMMSFCICSILCLIVSVWKSGLQTPVMIVCIGSVLLAVTVCTRFRRGVILCGIGLMGALFLFAVAPKAYSFLDKPLRMVAELTERYEYRTRLLSLADAVSGDSRAYAYERYRLQKQSWDLFCENIPFGGGRKIWAGDHSEFLDMLAYFGFVGLVFYVLYFICLMRFFSILGRFFIGYKSLFMLYLYIAVYLFASVANPIALTDGLFVIVIASLGLFFPYSPLSAESRSLQRLTIIDEFGYV